MTLNLFTTRPAPTPLTRETVRFNRTPEFEDLDTEVGRIVADALRHKQETAA